MSDYFTYKEILQRAYDCRNSVHSHQKIGVAVAWSYYFAKSILNPKKNIKKFNFTKNPTPQQGDHISRQIPKTHYLQLCRNHINFIESKKRMPTWNSYKGFKINEKLFCYILACVVIWQYQKNELPKEVNANSKVFVKPTETGNVVFDFFVKTFKFTPKTCDEILSYVANHFTYEYYYDDQKSNKQVITSRAGNCTDLLQMLVNLLIKLGYKWEVLHVHCSGGDGHVRARFKHSKHTGGEWIYRDIACVASSGNITCNWCTSNYTLLATNPDWFLENLNR